MTLEVAGDAADGIHRVGPDVDMAVAVEVHRVGAEAARHELRQAHGTGVGAFHGERVDLLLAGQDEELAQLLAEEFGTRRVVEAQGRQRIEHAPATGVAAVEGFHADDRDDHLGRHAVFLLGTGQGLGMLVPEVHTLADARLGDEDRPVVLPRLDLLGRAGDRIEDRLLALHLVEQRGQLFTGEAMIAGHFGNELGHLGRALIFAGGLRLADQTEQRPHGDSPAAHCLFQILHSCHAWAIHLRCV